MKSDFIAFVSHELRSPLASIMGYTEVLLDEVPGALTATQQEFLHTVYQASQRLKWLADGLLDVSRMESGQIELELAYVGVGELIETSVEAIRPVADDKGIALVVNVEAGLPAVRGDPRRLGQVLDNLLSNAVKFTEWGGRVAIQVQADGPQAIFVGISDTGMGIAPEDITHLFERFYRAQNAVGQGVAGSGLGLFISKKIAEAHGGRIEVESELGVGSTFRVRLPATHEVSLT